MLGNSWLGKHSYELRLLGFPYEGELVSQAHVYHFRLSSCMVHGAAPGDHKDWSATYKCESTVSKQWSLPPQLRAEFSRRNDIGTKASVLSENAGSVNDCSSTPLYAWPRQSEVWFRDFDYNK